MNNDNVSTLPGLPARPVKQQGPDFTPAGFGRRLTAALDSLKVPESERDAKVAEAAGVTIRTARRYLRSESQPRGTLNQMALADALEIRSSWLLFGEGLETKAEEERFRQFMERYRKNPPWRQRLLERTLTRMANKSPRVERLMDLQESGQLSHDDFLRLAGR